MEASTKLLLQLSAELEAELHENILPFWINQMSDTERGGFYGRMLNDGTVIPDAPRGAVLNARILWTFSAAYNSTGKEEYLQQARKSFGYFLSSFIDKEFGGVFWSVSSGGKMLNNRKQIYAQAFAIYALSEFYKASQDTDAIMHAVDLYNLIEKYAFDNGNNGYIEALARDWTELDDLRLSPKDANEPKSMNTHLHLLEAYTNLFDVWKDHELKKQLQNLIKLHLETILDSGTGHFRLFFDIDWNSKSEKYSYGHDIEGAWLVRRAAEVLDNQDLINKSGHKALEMARVTLSEGTAEDGSLFNEGFAGRVTDTDRHWWPQAEAIIGCIDAYAISKDEKFLNAALKTWEFVKQKMRHPSGEWWWLVNRDYEPDLSQDLAGEWKCPYHNARMCLEIMKRTTDLIDTIPLSVFNSKN
ncbi:MAG: N-acyl-D-glucosamine 2-epimerase [Lentimicrobium sp.]|nr:N-acyl-D-glucosamine 2-epimerase [Lentimicrobium sp.]